MKYEILKVNGYSYILSNFKRASKEFPQANFMGTGKALAGVLRKNQSLEDWISERSAHRQRAEEIANQEYSAHEIILKEKYRK